MIARAAICLLFLACLGPAAQADAPAVTPDSIRELIDRLGAPDFSQRELADAELRRLGIVAYDYLQEAVGHNDLEVRLRARAILRSLKQQHLFADLDPALRRLLTNYSSLSPAERQLRVLELSSLLPQQGVGAVARLARFEEVESIAQLAALGFLSCQMPSDPDRQRAFAEEIRANLADSSTTAARWLRLWAKSIVDPAASLAEWENVRGELHQSTALDDVALIQIRDYSLRLAQIDATIRAKDVDAADEWIASLAKEVKGDPLREQRWFAWLIDRKLWSVLNQYPRTDADRLSANPRLRYLIAEAQLAQGMSDEAEVTAREAFEDTRNGSRLEIAVWLDNDRGRFDWAEREYRAVIDDRPDDIFQQLYAHDRLAYMLHDIERDDAAADVLEDLIQLTEDSDDLRKTLELNPRGINDSRARMHLYRALDAERKGDTAKQLEELSKGFELNPTEIDLLIACHRFSDAPPQWRAQIERAIETVARRYQQEIQVERQRLERQPDFPMQGEYDSLAQTMNEYAWVIGNTTGDLQQALEYSKLSNEYVPGSAAFLDTLGRCYFAVGDFEQAIRHQTIAWERAPFEMQIRRQLDSFLDAQQQTNTQRSSGAEP